VGDCSEFTHLFSALCRAAGIPTKFVSGYGYDPAKGNNLSLLGHAFAFIYLPGVEWVPIDLTWGLPRGQFGELSNDHLIQLTSDGKNLVEGSMIKIPPNRVSYNYSGQNPNINFESTETIVREVAVDPQLSMAQYMEGDIQKFFVTVKNEGTQTVTNLNVELIADNSYFEVPGVQSISSLGSLHNQVVTFNVRVKGSVENSTITAHVTYDSPYGVFLAEDYMILTVPPSALPEGWLNTMLIVLIGVLVGVLIGVAVVLVRR